MFLSETEDLVANAVPLFKRWKKDLWPLEACFSNTSGVQCCIYMCMYVYISHIAFKYR